MHNIRSDAPRWRQTQHLLQAWRQQRVLLASQLETSLSTPPKPGDPDRLEQSMKGLRQALVDYLALGHFELYSRLLRPSGALRGLLDQAYTCYRRIGATTDLALNFHDKYDTDAASLMEEAALYGDLFRLARVLQWRFAEEDRLIALVQEAPPKQEAPIKTKT